MTELDQLNADLRLNEALYHAAKMRGDHADAMRAAEEMARLQNLFLLHKQQAESEGNL